MRPTLFLCLTLAAAAEPTFELREGDRVAFLGDAFAEREQYEGWVEMAATTRFADRSVLFRNLGWSGDLPNGASRCGLSLLQAGLEPPEEGWRQLQGQLATYRPTVLFTGYGMAASLPGGPSAEEFRQQFERLLDEAKDMRVVVLGTPPRFARPGESDAELKAHRESLAAIDAVLRDVAAKRKLPYVPLQALEQKKGLSDNGIHLNGAGYQAVARQVESALGWKAGSWDRGDTAAALRRAILRKNEWFFHRSRPANMAYIFGFRKAEQGRNAGEILAFDKLVADEEARIAEMRGLSRVVPEPPVRTSSSVAAHTPQPHPDFTVADGYEVSLWAENPLLFKPTQINFDSRGRMWVASAETYPQVEVGQTANDKILVLEDRDGDGKAETSTAFADGLLMPTGLLPDGDGVYVAQSTDLLYFRDTDGDGKADEKRRVLSGFGTEDTHHNLHTLRRGPDGNIWMNQSIYTRSDAETPGGVMRLKSGGVMRFDARRDRLEPVYFGWCNPWGHEVDRYGQSFVTDGAGGGGINWGVPGAMYFTYANAPRVLDSISPGAYPKFCGLEIIESPHFPQDWQGSMITCDFRAHRVVRFAVSDSGSGFAAQEVGDLLRTNDVNFRPIDVKIGPDGALYVADWSNPIINHGEVDFRDPRRDREHGRIWRISRKGAPLTPKPNMAKLSEPQLIELLAGDHRQHREGALEELQHRPVEKTRAAVKAWAPGAKSGLKALVALRAAGVAELRQPDLLTRALSDEDGKVRAAAVRVLGDWTDVLGKDAAMEHLKKAVADQYPRVRLEAVRALARLGGGESLDTALGVLGKPSDRFLDYALWLSVKDAGPDWMRELLAGKYPIDTRGAALEFVLGNLPAGQGIDDLRRLAPPALPEDGSGPWIGLAVKSGDPVLLEKLYDQALRQGFEPEVNARVLADLEAAVATRVLKLMVRAGQLGGLIDSQQTGVAAAAMRLSGALQAEDLLPVIVAAASSSDRPSLRLAAIDALSRFPSAPARDALKGLVASAAPEEVRSAAALALARHHRESALEAVRALLPVMTTEDHSRPFWQQALSYRGLSADLAKSLNAHPLEAAVAARHLPIIPAIDEHGALVEELRRQAGDLAPAPGADSAAIHELARLSLEKGDAARGELIYRRPAMACIACHAIGGAGGKVGPDMTSIGASAPADYLVESLLLPAAKVKEGYHAVILETRDGRTIMGRVLKSGGGQTIIADAAGQEITLADEAIVNRTDTGSMMPANLIDPLTEQEQHDLFKFLSQLGKPGDFDATKSRAPRVWAIMAATDQLPEGGVKGDPSLPWVVLTGTVNGRLLAAEAEPFLAGAPGALAASRFELASATTVTLTLPENVSAAWIDGREVKAGVKLEPGRHTLVVRFSPGTDLRVESSAGTFLPTW